MWPSCSRVSETRARVTALTKDRYTRVLARAGRGPLPLYRKPFSEDHLTVARRRPVRPLHGEAGELAIARGKGMLGGHRPGQRGVGRLQTVISDHGLGCVGGQPPAYRQE